MTEGRKYEFVDIRADLPGWAETVGEVAVYSDGRPEHEALIVYRRPDGRFVAYEEDSGRSFLLDAKDWDDLPPEIVV